MNAGVSFEERLADEGAGFVAEPAGAGRCVLIAFGGIRGGLGVPPYEFFRVTEGLDVRRVFVRDLDQVWYQRGIRGLGETPESAADALRAEIGPHPVVTVGNSAGGFGAIWFGAMLGAVEAHAFSPQTAIDRWHRLRWVILRWMAEMHGVRRLHLDAERLDLRLFLLAHPSALRIHLHVSSSHGRDMRHARHLEGLPTVAIQRYPSGGHRLVTDLRDTGDLAGILRTATETAARAEGRASNSAQMGADGLVRAGALAAPRLATVTTDPPVRGAALTVDGIEDAAIAWDDAGLLTYVGARSGLPSEAPEPEELPGGTWLAPGFVDCHTHLPFIGWRADEYAARLAGASYAGVQGEGGGISRSARMLAAASDEEVLAFSAALAAEMLAHGTTAFECKTGYGGSVEGELRQARLARRLAERVSQTCTVTLLPCHAVPPGWSREDWVSAAVTDIIPVAAAEGLADAVDIYVEPSIAFTLEDLGRVADAARTHGLALRVHADQLEEAGGAAAAATAGARAADHLNHASQAGVAALADASATAAVLLPASTFCLGASPAPARALIDAGATVALATDANPGTSPVVSMPETIAVGCRLYGLAPAEALAAATTNGAWVLGLGDRLGRLAPGLRADVLVLEGDGPDHLAYRPGHDPVLRTYVGGRLG